MSSMDSLSKEDEAKFSLLSVKEIIHSFLPILGLALVALVLMCLWMVDKMTDSLGTGAGLATFVLFGVGTA